MVKISLQLLLIAAIALSVSAQSGRRISPVRSAPAAPIQPPLNPEPELPATAGVEAAPALLALPESLRERQINMIENGSFRFADFQGKVVVINLWASWCGPCRREVPEYEKVRHAFVGREVEFVGLTTEDPRTSAGKVRNFLRDVDFNFRLGWADPQTARTLMNGKKAIPQTLVIDTAGRVVSHWAGYMPRHSRDRLTAAINQALETQ